MNQTKTKTVTTNLFAIGTKVKEPAKKVAEKKIIKAPLLGDKCQRYSELKQAIEAATGELKMIEGDIKTTGRELFLKEYRIQKNELVKTDLYEGLVLKKIESKLTFGFNEQNNSDWQIKCRKETKIYNF